MAMAPRLLMIVLSFVIVGGVLGYACTRGVGVFKKQGVAWGLTALMVAAAIGIGYARFPGNHLTPEAPPSAPPIETIPPDYQQGATAPNAAAAGYFLLDDAGVLSDSTMASLIDRNVRLYERYDVVIGVVTCNYGRDDLVDYAYEAAERMDLRDQDMLVVLDIKGRDCGLIQGAALVRDFTDDDCVDYVGKYMQRDFARGNYDAAVLSLTEMLEAWYGTYFG